MKLGKTAFVVTKPLQLMVAMTLREQLRLQHEAQLFLVDYFNEADGVCERIREYDSQWSSVGLYPTRKAALKACHGKSLDTIFIDSDVGMRTYINLCAIKIKERQAKIFVYEEGRGTYLDDYYKARKAALLRLLGVGDKLGGSRLTRGIWVYAPGEYTDKFSPTRLQVHEITNGLSSFISENSSLLDKLFCNTSYDMPAAEIDEDCIVYLSSWKVYETAIAALKCCSTRYIKLHPHIKDYDTSFLDEGCVLVPSSMPAELLLINLAKHYRSIDVYHHDSSVERYIVMPNINFINLHDR